MTSQLTAITLWVRLRVRLRAEFASAAALKLSLNKLFNWIFKSFHRTFQNPFPQKNLELSLSEDTTSYRPDVSFKSPSTSLWAELKQRKMERRMKRWVERVQHRRIQRESKSKQMNVQEMWSFLLLFIKSSVARFYELTFCLNSANIIPT